MWKNFLLSLALLGISLTTALYSSSASNEGRTGTATASAVISLILALWVGLRFVPRLAKDVNWNWIPGISKYKLTRDGWIFLSAIAIVVLAAINTSNNLLYMVLSVLISVLLLSGFLLELNFRYLETDILLPPRCIAGDVFSFSIRIRNLRRVFPMISVRIEPAADSPLNFESFYFAGINPLAHAKHISESVLPRRGRYTVREVTGASRFPFGLLSKKHTCEVNGEIVCYPAIVPRDRLNISALDEQGTIQRPERGAGYELHTIRDYVYSDGARHVHWKASAKTASLKTREYAADEGRRVILALDRFGTPEDTDDFEEQVTRAASLAFHCTADDSEVSFVSDDWRSGPGSPEVVLDSILEYLATVEMSAAASFPDVDPNGGSLLFSLRRRQG
jgi:uncharacterized protein (DUF58 family)